MSKTMNGSALGIKPPICPRCLGFIPSNERPGEYMGAISRLTRDRRNADPVEVCSACGQDEAMQEFNGGGATPMARWPMVTPTSPNYRPAGDTILDGRHHTDSLGRQV